METDTIIHCSTPNAQRRVLKRLEEQGYRWRGTVSPPTAEIIERGREACVRLRENHIITRGSRTYYESLGFEITSARAWLASQPDTLLKRFSKSLKGLL